MDIIDRASAGVRRRFAPVALALAGLLAAGCVHLPPRLRSGDALDPQEHVRLGSSYEAQGLRAEAVAQYEAAVRRDPACTEGWLALGNIAFMEGRFESAETSFRTALIAAPHHPGVCNNLAMTILARGGSLAEAEALARDALSQPGTLRPYILDTLANIQLRQRRYAEALDLVDQAEASTPADGALVRAQLKTTRDSIQAAAGVREYAPGQVPR
ncbi:MAG: tetratricopeptide repeat protein [Elusimicrobia bacterium]|nr:tetratricopeptide repeat protein [Elusimicrobiota bacterium]